MEQQYAHVPPAAREAQVATFSPTKIYVCFYFLLQFNAIEFKFFYFFHAIILLTM